MTAKCAGLPKRTLKDQPGCLSKTNLKSSLDPSITGPSNLVRLFFSCGAPERAASYKLMINLCGEIQGKMCGAC